MAESGLPHGKTFATLDFAVVPTIRKAHVMALAEGDAWIEQGGNLLIFGPSGTGKTHLAAAFGTALVDKGKRVLFTRTTDLVQKLQAARRDLALPGTLAKLDRFDVLVLDDLGYIRKDQAETNVLFKLIAERYERKSLITTCNQPFSEWDQIFPDPAMTVAAIDRLVHHATILELNTESYRRRSALATSAKAAAAAARVIIVAANSRRPVAAATGHHQKPANLIVADRTSQLSLHKGARPALGRAAGPYNMGIAHI